MSFTRDARDGAKFVLVDSIADHASDWIPINVF